MAKFDADKFLKELFEEQKSWEQSWEKSNQIIVKMQESAMTLDPTNVEMTLAWVKLGYVISSKVQKRKSKSMAEDAAFLKSMIDWLLEHPTGQR